MHCRRQASFQDGTGQHGVWRESRDCDARKADGADIGLLQDAVKLAQDRFDAGNPHRMSIVVNAAVFYHDFMNMQSHAIELTESELKKAAETVADPVDGDTRAIMGILQTNLQLWKGDEDH